MKLTIFEVVVKGYHECSFAVSVGEKHIIRRKGGDRGPALKVLDENDREMRNALEKKMRKSSKK